MSTAPARVLDPAAAAAAVAEWRAAGARVVALAGDFDLLTVDHLRALARARARADRVVVAVRGDREVAARGAAGRPVLPARDRAALAAALRGADLVTVLAGPAADAPARALGAHDTEEAEGGRDLPARVRARQAGDA